MTFKDVEPIVYVDDDGTRHPAKVLWWIYPLEAEVCTLEWTTADGSQQRETCGPKAVFGGLLGPRTDGRSCHWAEPE